MTDEKPLLEWEEIAAAMQAGLSHPGTITDGINAMIRALPEWSRPEYESLVSGRDFDLGISEFTDWMTNLVQGEPVPESAEVLHFGIIEMSDGVGGKRMFTMYPCAWSGFDIEDEELGYEGWDWIAEEPYIGHTVVQEIYEADEHHAHIELIGGVFAGRLAAEIVSRVEPALMLGSRTQRHLTSGWDEGNIFLVGELKRDGIVRAPG